MSSNLLIEHVWFAKSIVDAAEQTYYENKYGGNTIKLTERLNTLVEKKAGLSNTIETLRSKIAKLETRVVSLEKSSGVEGPAATSAAPVKKGVEEKKSAADDDDFDPFASDDEEDDAEAEKLKAERVAAYNAKKSKKTAVIAKSSILLDVKPWDDETDMAALEKCVRSIEMPGLLWGVSKLAPVAYNVKKLQILCVVEDDLVSIEELTEKIEAFEDYVQSVDVAAFQKI